MILGVDPSLSCTGWGVIENSKVIATGTIKTTAKQTLEQRLFVIYTEIKRIATEYEPDAVGIEDVFVNRRNMSTSIKLAKVHGVIVGALVSQIVFGSDVHVYAPKFIKETITGSGTAEKEQVLKMVQLETGYEGSQLDISDALAAALTCERAL
jgi:crossover junction endodeoxyribonuclease RuvC